MFRKRHGLSLLELVVGIAISGIALFAVMQTTKLSYSQLKSLDNRADIEELRADIRLRVNCQKTMSHLPGPWVAGVSVAAYDKLDQVFIANPHSDIAKQRIRVKSAASARTFQFERWISSESRWVDVFSIPFVCPI